MTQKELLENIGLFAIFYFYSNDDRFICVKEMGRDGLSVYYSRVCTEEYTPAIFILLNRENNQVVLEW